MALNYSELAVVKSNRIIEAKYKLSPRAQKFILLMVSMIEVKDTEFKYQTIKIKDIEDILNIDGKKWGGIYQEMKDIILSLNNRPLKIQNDDGSMLIMNWIASAEIRKGKGVVEFEFSEKLKPYLLQLKSHFTRFKLHNILKLKSSFSIRLYELMKARQFLGNVTYTLKELKEILVLEGKYGAYYDFKRRVLLPAQKELQEFCDVYFEYEEQKQGRAVHALSFQIFENKKITDNSTVEKVDDISDAIIQAIQTFGFSAFKAVELCQLGFDVLANVDIREQAIAAYESFEDFLRDKIELVQFEMKHKSISNPAGYFLKALQENYQSNEFKAFKKRKQKRKENQQTNAMKQQYLQLYEAQSKLFANQQQQLIENIIQKHPNIIDELIQTKRLKYKKEDYQTSVMFRTKINYLITQKYPDEFVSLQDIEQNMKQLKKSIDAM